MKVHKFIHHCLFIYFLFICIISLKSHLILKTTVSCLLHSQTHLQVASGRGSPPVQLPPVSSHFYPDQLHVSNITSNGRKYSTSILSKPQRFPTKPTAQIDAVHCQAHRHLLRRPPPPRLHLGFRPDHHHYLVIYTRVFPQFFEEEREMREK